MQKDVVYPTEYVCSMFSSGQPEASRWLLSALEKPAAVEALGVPALSFESHPMITLQHEATKRC